MTEETDEPGAEREEERVPAQPGVGKLDEAHGMTAEEIRNALPGSEERLEELEAALADARIRYDEALGFFQALHARLRTLEEGEIRGG